MAIRECDYCSVTDSLTVDESGKEIHTVNKIGDNYACPNHKKDAEAELLKTGPALIPVNSVLKQSREIDNQIQVRTDVFNAQTVSIQELKSAIDSDPAITNKPYQLALELKSRYQKFRDAIFEMNQKIVEATTNQRAIQTYLNQLANTLRAEEREKLKIQDINYNPRPVKMPVNAKTIKLSKKRLDTKQLRTYASELGIPEYTLRMVAIQKNLDAKGVYELFKANLNAAKEKSNPTPITTPVINKDDEVVDMTGTELESN